MVEWGLGVLGGGQGLRGGGALGATRRNANAMGGCAGRVRCWRRAFLQKPLDASRQVQAKCVATLSAVYKYLSSMLHMLLRSYVNMLEP